MRDTRKVWNRATTKGAAKRLIRIYYKTLHIQTKEKENQREEQQMRRTFVVSFLIIDLCKHEKHVNKLFQIKKKEIIASKELR